MPVYPGPMPYAELAAVTGGGAQHAGDDGGAGAAAGPLEGLSCLSRLESALELGLLLSRGLVLIPVVVLVIAAAGAFVYGTALFFHSTADVIRHPFPVGDKTGLFLLVVDLFLVGATLLIAAIGFYELFIRRAGRPRRSGYVPRWLTMNDLNDLKTRVVSMLVLVAAASFVVAAVDFHGGHDIFFLGAAVAVVIAALTIFLRFGADRSGA